MSKKKRTRENTNFMSFYFNKDIEFYLVIFGTFSTSTNEEIGINSAKKMVGATNGSFA